MKVGPSASSCDYCQEYVHRSNGKAADDYAHGEGQAFIVKNLCVKNIYIKTLNNIQVKARIFGGKHL